MITAPHSRVLLVAGLTAAACTDAGGVDLLVPDDVVFAWHAAYDEPDDRLVAVLPLDVMVYDPATGLPAVGQRVRFVGARAGLVPVEWLDDAAVTCDGCAWDAYRDEVLDLDPVVAVEALEVEVDAAGLARVYAVVDSLAGAGDAEVEVWRVEGEQPSGVVRLVPR